MTELTVLLNDSEAGVVTSKNGRLTFTYDDKWRGSHEGYPLSLSMPLSAREHPHKTIEPFIWGLLPDNELVLSRWAQKYQVSARNAFALISHVGEDAAGAVQFVKPERLSALGAQSQSDIEWLLEREVADRLRQVKADASAGRLPHDTGQFSLAGAQPKTALLFDGKRWGVPSGRTPTTHILKPTTDEFDGHAENEQVCLKLAEALGLPTANSEVRRFEDVTAIVSERFDRMNVVNAAKSRAEEAQAVAATRGPSDSEIDDIIWLAQQLAELAKTTAIARLHQEDLCQALAVHPANKYQNQGGPSLKQIIDLIRASVSSTYGRYENAANDDVETFVDALIFNWIIGGTDAHAKNYSLLLGGGGMVRLAPLYDIASILAYPHIDPRKAKLAMKIGDEYGLMDVRLSDWRKLAATCKLDGEQVLARIASMAKELPDRLSDEVRAMRNQGLNHRVIDVLSDVLPKRAAAIAAM